MRISHSLRAGLATIAGLAAFSTPVTALSQDCARCEADGERIIACLEKDWGESVFADALNRRGHLVRWLANEETGSWSMVVSLPNGAACLTASGKHFDMVQMPVGEPS